MSCPGLTFLSQALLGFERNITHLDGHIVQLKRNGVTQPGFVQVIQGEGMPIYESTGYGDLYVEYNVILPSELSSEMRSSESLIALHRPDAELITTSHSRTSPRILWVYRTPHQG